MPPPRDQQTPSRSRRRKEPMPGGWLWIALMLLFLVLMVVIAVPTSTGMDYSKFMKLAQDGYFSHVIVRGNRLFGEFNKSKLDELEKSDKELKDKYVRNNKAEAAIPSSEQVSGRVTKLLDESKVDYRAEEEVGNWFGPVFMVFLPTLLLAAFVFF